MTEDSKETRCEICGWPLGKSLEDGCIPGNCSYRPGYGSPEYYRIKARIEELKIRDADKVEIERLKAVIAQLENHVDARRRREAVFVGFVNGLIVSDPQELNEDYDARAIWYTANRAEAVMREVEQIPLPEVTPHA